MHRPSLMAYDDCKTESFMSQNWSL